jgi:signal transduction histidine kinase
MSLRRFRLFRRFGLPERLIAVLLLVFVIDVVCNTVLFERANTFELRRDDAQRIAENLVLARRAVEHSAAGERQAVTAALSTAKFSLKLTDQSKRYRGSLSLANLRAQVIEMEPELAHSDLELHLESIPREGNIGGSLRLVAGGVLDFRTHARSAWKLSIGRFASLVLPTVLLISLAWLLLRAALNPLRSLVRATRHFDAGPPRPVPEHGPDEMRELIRAMNEMQERIHQSMLDRTHTMLAIGHDLKTPLSRIRLRLDDGEVDPVVRDGINHDIDEMRMLLDSIQAYVDTGGTQIPAERIDLAIMAETLVDTAADRGADASYSGLSSLVIMARPVSIRRALSNLIENALHYGGNVRVGLRKDGGAAEITVDDDGPGIPEDRITDALQPFIRLDTARARDTAGMGLGLPIVRKAVRLEGGTLDLRNRPEGGLRATIRLPLAAQ